MNLLGKRWILLTRIESDLGLGLFCVAAALLLHCFLTPCH